jgi:hydrogenase/urease accessory protein HupE
MRRRHARSQVRSLLASACGLLLPGAAGAHLPTIGLGPVYDGVFHLLLSPEDLIPVIALALLCGQRGAPFGRRALWLVPLAWFAGGLMGLFAENSHGAALTCVSFLLLGGLVAANARVSLPVLSVLAALLGSFHGYLNGAGINRFDDGTYALLGLSLAVFVVVALCASLVIPLRQQWTRIAVRVAGSWIAASGLLMLGWALHAARSL